jgi:uncharacterized DUF497 family protein
VNEGERQMTRSVDNCIHIVYTNVTRSEAVLHIEVLEIDDHILEKIEVKHGISYQEVEEACYADTLHLRRSREGLYKLFSRTLAGRYILVVLIHIETVTWKIVTAREMTVNERRLYKMAIGSG